MNYLTLSRVYACVFVCFSTQVFADKDSTSSHSSIEEIIVTSSFLNPSFKDGALPLHVVGRDEISQGATQSLGESLDSLLGVASTDYGSAVGQPVIRGMSGSRVKVLNNGIVMRDASGIGADHVNDIDMNNIQQIEVIRGPASLLYANGTIGGIVNIVDQTIAKKDFLESIFKVGLEAQSVNDGDAHDLSYENNVGGLNISLGYKKSEFGNFDIPYGSVLHSDEEHDDDHHEEEVDHGDEEYNDEDHEKDLGYLPNSDFESTSKRLGISKTGNWGYFGVSVNKIESVYGIPFHGDNHGDEHGDEHVGERIFSTTESDILNFEGTFIIGNDWLRQIDYHVRDTDYSLTEQHAEEEEHEGDEHEGEEHDEEAPAVFQNAAKEYGATFDFSNDTLTQKVAINFVDEGMSIIGSEAFMNPSKSEELTLGYFASKDFDVARLDFGIRFDQINRVGSLSHTDEHGDEHEDEHGEEHGDDLEAEVDMFDQDLNTTSFAFNLSSEINESLNVSMGYAQVERAPSVVELYMNGPHLATGKFEVGNTQLDVEKSNNIDVTFSYQQDGFFGALTLFKNDVKNYIYLMDETEEAHDEHDDEDHSGLPLANYVQRDAEFDGYELEFGKVFDLSRGTLTASFGRDSVSGEFAAGVNLPRIVPERNIYRLSYAEDTFKALLTVKDVKKQSSIGLNESVTNGYTMLDLSVRKSFALSPKINMSFVVLGNNLLDEVARNHSSFVKDEVPLPGKNYGIKLLLEF